MNNSRQWVTMEEYGIKVSSDGVVIGRLGKPIYGELDKDGYRRVNVRKNGELRKHKFVHRLVAECFLPTYSEKLVVNHMDCDKTNNSVSNLEMLTSGDNTRHAIANGMWTPKRGEDSRFNKYPKELVVGILKRLETVERHPSGNIKAGELMKIADELGTTRHVVKNYSRKRKIWKHLQETDNVS